MGALAAPPAATQNPLSSHGPSVTIPPMPPTPAPITDALINKVAAKLEAAVDANAPANAIHWLHLLNALSDRNNKPATK